MGHLGPVGQYSPVDSEVGGSNLGDGKSLFLLTPNMKRCGGEEGQKLDPFELISLIICM